MHESDDAGDDREEPRCACGYGSDHYMVSANGEYSFTGWCFLLFGITATPKRVRWECRVCGETIKVEDEPGQIAERL